MECREDLQNYINRLELENDVFRKYFKKINTLARYSLKDKVEKRKENLLKIIEWTN